MSTGWGIFLVSDGTLAGDAHSIIALSVVARLVLIFASFMALREST